uniref:B30.2/SPRY domain-containing protein n=2 Tax=Sus scrofa TaxID=9823 RepID=A0A5G2QGN7_PIG
MLPALCSTSVPPTFCCFCISTYVLNLTILTYYLYLKPDRFYLSCFLKCNTEVIQDRKRKYEGFKRGKGIMTGSNGKDNRSKWRRKKAKGFPTFSFAAWRDAPLYPDWRKEEFKAANVTLDEATAHPALLVSERGRRVTWQETCQDLPRSTQRFNSIPCVLGQLRINSGRACWEVEVGDMQSWDLGICRDNVTREGVFTMSPQNGFWAIRLYDGDYWALTSPETSLPLRERPLKVGIFLDYEAGDVSFYNMTDGSHIFTFPQSTFYGVLRPLFRLWSSDSGSLTICSAEGECTDVVIHMPTLQVK